MIVREKKLVKVHTRNYGKIGKNTKSYMNHHYQNSLYHFINTTINIIIITDMNDDNKDECLMHYCKDDHG